MPKKRPNRRDNGRFKSRKRSDAAYQRWENRVQTWLRWIWWALVDFKNWFVGLVKR